MADSLPLPFATGLFSFLYHLAYYEIGKYNQNIVLEFRNSHTYHGCKTVNIRLLLACSKFVAKHLVLSVCCQTTVLHYHFIPKKSDYELQYLHVVLCDFKAVFCCFVSTYSGAEALVSCGLLEALLRVVEHQGGDSHLTVRKCFV